MTQLIAQLLAVAVQLRIARLEQDRPHFWLVDVAKAYKALGTLYAIYDVNIRISGVASQSSVCSTG
jgi:hypothetical protein